MENCVALFARAWIEILKLLPFVCFLLVSLFARAWIEISQTSHVCKIFPVALFARAWIEIVFYTLSGWGAAGRPLHEGVD